MKKGVFLALLLMLLAAFPALAEDVYYADASQGGSVTSDKGYLSVSWSAGYGQPRYNDHPRRVGIDGLSARLRRVQRNVRVRGSVSAADWRTDDVSRHPVHGQR